MNARIVLVDRGFSPNVLGESGALDLRNIGENAWEEIVANCNANDLRLYHLSIRSFAGIERLHSTNRLSVCWANKITEINPICQMSWLERLSLSDLPNLHSIDGIESLECLIELHLSGNMGSLHPPMRLNSVKAIARLSKLEKLKLSNIRLQDRDISFIASSFPNLRSLWLSNEFEREQLAFLAKRLNGQLETPIEAYIQLNVNCRVCGGPQYIFTGRRMPLLCKKCDNERFDGLSRAFEQLIEKS